MKPPRPGSRVQLAVVPLAGLVAVSLAGAGADPVGAEPPAGLHAPYDSLLCRYVDERGVRYRAWQASEADRRGLQSYVHGLESVDPASLDHDQALAFWVNLYNAVTLDLILDHYPVESIRDIGGEQEDPWERTLVRVAGRDLTLNEIEHGILRPRYEDPRIHFALSCAAKGCPPLASHAFVGARLQAQLEAVTAAALDDSAFVDVSACRGGEGTIRISRIFEWYARDWDGVGGVRAFLARYRPGDRERLLDARCELDYHEYDWALNDASPVP